MSGALVDLVATGIQNAFITGNPQVSFFRSNYKRFVNFSLQPARLDVVGEGNDVRVRLDKKGDLLTSVWVDVSTLVADPPALQITITKMVVTTATTGTITYVTASPRIPILGDQFTIVGWDNATYNGTYNVTGTPTDTTCTFLKIGASMVPSIAAEPLETPPFFYANPRLASISSTVVTALSATICTVTHGVMADPLALLDTVVVTGHTGTNADLALNQTYTVTGVNTPTETVLTVKVAGTELPFPMVLVTSACNVAGTGTANQDACTITFTAQARPLYAGETVIITNFATNPVGPNGTFTVDVDVALGATTAALTKTTPTMTGPATYNTYQGGAPNADTTTQPTTGIYTTGTVVGDAGSGNPTGVYNPTSNINVTQLDTPTEFSLYIGNKMIDRQDGFFINTIWPECLATNPTKALRPQDAGSLFFPLHFFHCDNYETPIPLVALQNQTAEIQVKYSPHSVPGVLDYWAEYVQLDTDERKWFTDNTHNLLITQMQKVVASSTGSDLCYLNHPVKSIMWGTSREDDTFETNAVQLSVNGVDVFRDPMPYKYFNTVQRYQHTDNTMDYNNNTIHMFSFGESANKIQPTGSCNFSRLDDAKIQWTATATVGPTTPTSVYAVNYNVLTVKNGSAGILFSN